MEFLIVVGIFFLYFSLNWNFTVKSILKKKNVY